MTESWLAADLADRQERFALGDYQALAEAVSLCIWNNEPLPDWTAQPILDSLLHSINTGGATSGGRGGGHRVQTGLAYIHSVRAAAYRAALLDGKKGAAERASEMLRERGSPAWGSPRQIKRSFDKVEVAANRS